LSDLANNAGPVLLDCSDQLLVTPEQMKQVLDVSRMLAVTTDLDPLLLRIAQAATALLNCERASIFIHDKAKKQLFTKVALQLQTKEIRIPDTAGIAGAAFQHNELIHVSNPYEDARFNPEPDRRSGFVTRNLLTVPMVDVDRRPVGVLQAVNKRDGDFTPDDKALIRLVADQAGVAIQRYQLQVVAMENIAMRREMDLARKVQEALIPKIPPKLANTETAGWTKPASVTGGDCFDIWRLKDGRLGLFLADASGHGIAPALVVSQVRTLLRALCDLEPDPHRLMTLINHRIAEDLEVGWFVTTFIGILSEDGLLHWCSAGQGPIYLRPDPDAPLRMLEPLLPPIGILPDLATDKCEPVQLQKGGAVIATTDGIFECRNPAGELFGTDRLTAVIGTQPRATAQRMLTSIRDAAAEFADGVEPADDQTILVAMHV
jgi:phosphoserine phosphatase